MITLMNSKYAMNTKTGELYSISTGYEGSRSRYSVKTHSGEHTQVASSHLAALSDFEADIALKATKILRWKKAMTWEEQYTVKMYRDLKKRIVA